MEGWMYLTPGPESDGIVFFDFETGLGALFRGRSRSWLLRRGRVDLHDGGIALLGHVVIGIARQERGMTRREGDGQRRVFFGSCAVMCMGSI